MASFIGFAFLLSRINDALGDEPPKVLTFIPDLIEKMRHRASDQHAKNMVDMGKYTSVRDRVRDRWTDVKRDH